MDHRLASKGSMLLSGLAMFLVSGCTPNGPASASPTIETSPAAPLTPTHEIPYFPIPAGYDCGESIVLEWPIIDDVIPNPASPGSAIEILGHGGAIRCGNAYDESSRDFEIYLDELRLGTVNCYVNHCEGTVDLPGSLEQGTYSLSIGPEQEYELVIQLD